jgi:hypothetical protein
MKRVVVVTCAVLFVISAGSLSGCAVFRGKSKAAQVPEQMQSVNRECDQELGRLLVRLVLRTRGTVLGHYVAADDAHRDWMAKNVLLPAAVADKVFYEAVPAATGNRAWVKMVVDQPRNPHNAGDATASALLGELRGGRPNAQREAPEAFYYAEPIKAVKPCLVCHGKPAGDPDPFFPQFKKEAWEEGQVVGAVVSRVTPRP